MCIIINCTLLLFEQQMTMSIHTRIRILRIMQPAGEFFFDWMPSGLSRNAIDLHFNIFIRIHSRDTYIICMLCTTAASSNPAANEEATKRNCVRQTLAGGCSAVLMREQLAAIAICSTAVRSGHCTRRGLEPLLLCAVVEGSASRFTFCCFSFCCKCKGMFLFATQPSNALRLRFLQWPHINSTVFFWLQFLYIFSMSTVILVVLFCCSIFDGMLSAEYGQKRSGEEEYGGRWEEGRNRASEREHCRDAGAFHRRRISSFRSVRAQHSHSLFLTAQCTTHLIQLGLSNNRQWTGENALRARTKRNGRWQNRLHIRILCCQEWNERNLRFPQPHAMGNGMQEAITITTTRLCVALRSFLLFSFCLLDSCR